jgi:hypothetical protein
MKRRRSVRRLRRRYANSKYPLVALKFEDGHEIRLKKGEGKTFDAFAGETIKIIVLWDPTAADREVISVMKAEQFEDGEET